MKLTPHVVVLVLLAFTFPCATAEGVDSTAADSLTLTSLKPPAFLPDGTEFKTWEQPLRFTKTYYVNASHSKASDQNPGSKALPFATVNRAAQILQPGERVVVAAGVYRERISPARGGRGPSAMISYEAAPGAKVILKGSRVFREPWTLEPGAQPFRMWRAKLTEQYFTDYNPFAIDNVTARQFDIMDYAAPLRGKAPCTLTRGLVFQNGWLLKQVAKREDLARMEGSYWVDRTNQMLYARFYGDVSPEQVEFEITTQETVFAPEQMGLGYIRVKGFTVEHTGGPFPWEQVGAISTTRGHHWIIEDNTVAWANGVGMDVGIQLHGWPQPPLVGFHIVRRNTVTDCGICGICGLGPGRGREFGLLIEDNVLRRNSFHDIERLYETAAIKTHDNVRCLIRRNLITDTYHGGGIWMDWNNQNSRCCQNVILRSKTIHGGIFVEASYVPNLIDQNFIWDTQGHGIYEHDSCRQIFAHNFVGRSTACGLHLHGKITDRRVGNREPEYGVHQVMNNLLFQNGKPDQFLGPPSRVVGNVSYGLFASLDPDRLEMTWSMADQAAATCDSVSGITHDFAGKPRNPGVTAAGLFNNMPIKPRKVSLKPKLDGSQPAAFPFYESGAISSKWLRVSFYLPDARKGYYRGTRFDWSGLISRVDSQGHTFFSEFRKDHDPFNHDDICGTAEEFSMTMTPPGFDTAKPGEGFIKIGVGVLEKGQDRDYAFFKHYKILDAPEWRIRSKGNQVEFAQELKGSDGWGYHYTKTIRLEKDAPAFSIVRRLQNTGTRTLDTDHYGHNFLKIDHSPAGPDYLIDFPFVPRFGDGSNPQGCVELNGTSLNFLKEVPRDKAVWVRLEGFEKPADNQFGITNRRTGARMTVTTDQSLARFAYYSSGGVLSPEPFVKFTIAPGETKEWTTTYRFDREP